MIQRIQTLYLAGVVALTALTLWLPLAHFTAGLEHFDLYAFGLRDAEGSVVQQTLYLGILAALSCLLGAVEISCIKGGCCSSGSASCKWCCWWGWKS